jgi:hypothetical protein
MAKKPPVSYAAVSLDPIPGTAADALPTAATQAAAPARAEPQEVRRGRPPVARTLKEAAAPVMLYLHPAGAKALKRYALDQNTKVHSLLLDAVEEWARSKGLREPMRVDLAVKREGH